MRCDAAGPIEGKIAHAGKNAIADSHVRRRIPLKLLSTMGTGGVKKKKEYKMVEIKRNLLL